MKIHYISLMLVFLSFWACKKEIQEDNSDKNFPLHLRHNKINGSDSFSWDEVRSSNFRQYILVRSITPIAAGMSPILNQSVFQSAHYADTTAAPSTNFFFDALSYYKLYAQIGDRWLESNEIPINTAINSVTGIPVASIFYPDSNWVITLKRDNSSSSAGKLVLTNLTTNKVILSTQSYPISVLDQIAMTVGHSLSGAPELYITTSTSFKKVSLPLLVVQSTQTSFSAPYSVAEGGGSTLILTNGNTSTSLNLRKKSDFSIIKSISRTNYFEHRTLGVLDTATNLVIEASSSQTQVFNINAVTGVISGTLTANELGNSPFLFQLPMSPDKQFFCPNSRGTIYDRSLNMIGTANPNPNNAFLSDVAFSNETGILYSLGTDFFTSQRRITKVNFGQGSTIESETEIPLGLIIDQIGYMPNGLAAVVFNQNSLEPSFKVELLKL